MKQPGFTLIELLITLVILGLLASIAVPSYQRYVISSRLTEAFNNLTSYRVQMEQSYQDNSNYGTASCSVTLPTGSYFNYSCAITNSGQGFTATATGNGTGGVTSSYVYTIDEAGNRRTTQFPSATVPASCWLTSASGC